MREFLVNAALLFGLLALSQVLSAQDPARNSSAPAESPSKTAESPSNKMSDAEQKELSSALAEAGSSPIEFARILERHLQKYPNSPQTDEIERALVKAAMEAKDDRRTLLYGERVLAKNSDNPQI